MRTQPGEQVIATAEGVQPADGKRQRGWQTQHRGRAVVALGGRGVWAPPGPRLREQGAGPIPALATVTQKRRE